VNNLIIRAVSTSIYSVFTEVSNCTCGRITLHVYIHSKTCWVVLTQFGFAGLFYPNFGSNMDQPNCCICWVVLTQFWVKYGPTQLLYFLGCFNPILDQILTNLIVGFAGLF